MEEDLLAIKLTEPCYVPLTAVLRFSPAKHYIILYLSILCIDK